MQTLENSQMNEAKKAYLEQKDAKNKKDYKLSYEITKKISELNKPF